MSFTLPRLPAAAPPRLRSTRVAAAGIVVWLSVALSGRAAARDAEGYRPLAPGVLTEIPPDDSTEEITARIDVPRILRPDGLNRWKPEMSPQDRTLLGQFAGPGGGVPPGYAVQRDLWCLAFSFAPPRLIDVDIPAAGLQMQRKRLWYMIYRVKNVGGWKLDIDPADTTVRFPKRFELPVRFLPGFVLETHQSMAASEGLVSYRSYADRVVPAAMTAIQRRERLGGELFDSVTMAASDIEPGQERFGVAVWEGVHPQVSFFSVIVTGLTNRFCFRPPIEGRPEGRPDRREAAGGSVTLESLRLDFWHRGDAKNPAEASINIGFFGLFERVALGGRLVEAVGRVGVSKARPTAGFARLGTSWKDFLDPPLTERQALDRRVPVSLEPLARVIESIGRIESPSDRTVAVRDIFGDSGPEAIEAVLRSVDGRAGEGGAARAEALRAIGVARADLEGGGFAGLAKLIRGLDTVRPTANRDAAAAAVFGDDVRRFASLEQGFLAARTVAVLDELGVDQPLLGTLGGRQAFERVRREMQRGRLAADGDEAGDVAAGAAAQADSHECWEPDREASRLDAADRRLAEGLFGAEGPMLFATATARHEGIDHRWFFRYEIDEE